MVSEAPAHDAAPAEIDDDGQVEPTGTGRDEGDVPGPGLIRSCGKRFSGEEVWRGSVGAVGAGFRDEVFWLDDRAARRPAFAPVLTSLPGGVR